MIGDPDTILPADDVWQPLFAMLWQQRIQYLQDGAYKGALYITELQVAGRVGEGWVLADGSTPISIHRTLDQAKDALVATLTARTVRRTGLNHIAFLVSDIEAAENVPADVWTAEYNPDWDRVDAEQERRSMAYQYSIVKLPMIAGLQQQWAIAEGGKAISLHDSEAEAASALEQWKRDHPMPDYLADSKHK